MKQRKRTTGSLTIPNGAKPEEYEISVAMNLTKAGYSVTFIEPIDSYKRKTPDIFMNGVEWEIKGPLGSGYQTLSRQIKRGLKQSKSIIIDGSRMKMLDADIERWLKKNINEHKSLQNLKYMTKDGKIVDIK